MSTAKKIIDKFTDVQPLPHVVTTLSRLIADNESTIRDFEEVIKMDPILVTRLLRLVNSPYYGLIQKVDSIGRAVVFIGMKNLHNLAVTDALKNIFDKPGKRGTVFSRKRLWMHSAVVSICSKMVAERIFGINGDDAYLCGILHDFGLLVEEQVKREPFYEICKTCTSTSSLVKLEQEAFGTNHCEIGHRMTLDWNMPEDIMVAIRDHHTIMDDLEPSSLTGIIQIAEFIADQLKYTTLPGITTEISPPLIEHLKENEDEYTVLMEDLPDEMENAQAIYA